MTLQNYFRPNARNDYIFEDFYQPNFSYFEIVPDV